MSKIANAYKMYLLLRGRSVVPIAELAEKLEVDPRMIKTYKRELVNAGIPIESKKGKAGGYYLKFHGHLPMPLAQPDKLALDLALSFLRQNQFVHYDNVEKIIREHIRLGDISSDIYTLKYIHDSDAVIEKRQRYFPIIGTAIKERQKLTISYHALSTRQDSQRLVWPLKLFDYMDTTYMAAYCEQAAAVRSFKLSRISQLTLEHSYFRNSKDSDVDAMLKRSYGVFEGSPITVDLTLRHPFSEVVKEKVIADNQQITDIDNSTVRFVAIMSGIQEISGWVLSMGEFVTVNGGDELKENVKQRIAAMVENNG